MPKLDRKNRLTIYKPDKTPQVFEQVADLETHVGRIIFSHTVHMGNHSKTTRYITSFPFCFEETLQNGEE